MYPQSPDSLKDLDPRLLEDPESFADTACKCQISMSEFVKYVWMILNIDNILIVNLV